jgi:ribonuclease P protein component
MLSARYRFHGHGSLRYVYKNGTAERSRLFTVKTTKNPRRKTSRFAVVVSKKVHKSATGRNRIRRRIYELIRNELPFMSGVYDVAIIVSSSDIIAMPHDELRQQLTSLLSQADLYSKE